MDAMKMLEDFCAEEPAPTRDWLATERARIAAVISAAPPGPQRRVPRLPRAVPRPIPLRLRMVGAVTIAAATALVIGLVLPSGPGRTQARIQTDAYVVSHTEAALYQAAAGDWLVHVRTSLGPKGRMSLGIGSRGSLTAQQEYTWYHGPDSNGPLRDEGLTAAGQPVFDWGVVQTPDVYTTTIVDYKARTWWRVAQHVTPWTPTPASALTCSDVNGFAQTMDPTYWAADIHKALSCGQFAVSGTEQVDGVDAIKLTPVRPGIIASVLLVDPSTYLPLRVAEEFRGRPDGQVEDVQWLPPTNANLANLTVPIPSGFAQVSPPLASQDVCAKGTSAKEWCAAIQAALRHQVHR